MTASCWGSRSRHACHTARVIAAVALLLAVVGVAVAQWPEWLRRDPGPEPDFPDLTVTAAWLSAHLNERGVVVLDARPRHAYVSAHIPGSVSIDPWLPVDTERLAKTLGDLGLSGRERIVCCGEDSYSGRAARVFWLLELAGARDVALLEGGVGRWRERSGRTVSDETGREPLDWLETPDPRRLATREFVRRSFGEPGVEVVDARGTDAWRGPVSEPEWGSCPRSGHIPHSLPFDFRAFVDSEGEFLEPGETWLAFAALGPRPSNPVDLTSEFVVHGDGKTGDGALAYYLLRRSGIERVRYYPGGWDDWVGDPYLPVVRIVGAEELMSRLRGERRWFRPNAPPEGFAFLDVRHPSDHEHGHIAGSVSLDSRIFADSLGVVLERYWPAIDVASAPIVTYCYGQSCIRSRATSTAAARHGFVYIDRFYGGVDEWRGVGGKLVSGG